MIRSNSSSGVTTFHNINHPPSPNKLHRNRNNLNRNNSENITLKTFRVNQSSFRGGSPSRTTQPTLADLEFPPPPTDLPPPEEFSEENNINENQTEIKTELSVEEAGTRFGISLRHREPSSDSCSSAKSKNENSPEKSPNSEQPNLESSLDSLPPPPSSNEEEEPKNDLFKNTNMKEMLELKLVAEIKERADQKTKNPKETSPNEPLTLTSVNNDPLLQLVSELSETMNIENIVSKKETISYKTQLKKVDPPIKRPKEEIINSSSGVIDFKSRLRKIDNVTEKKTDKEIEEEKTIENETETNKRESTASSDSSSNLKLDENDDKRKSTGSISSLKKLWEAKETSETLEKMQLSPKLTIKNLKNEKTEDISIVESLDESPLIRSASGRNTSKIWPPNSEEKPAVPIKPVVKGVKPLITAGKPSSAIYATPIAPKPPILAKPTNIDNKTDDSENIIKTNTERDNILEISQALESSLNSIRNNPSVSTATWLQLSDKIGLLHGSCMGYADSVVPAHTKFHFRELLTKLELQGRQLRSAGSKNITENTRQLNEVSNTVKDVVNAVKIF